ncbi:MAG: SsrA-binding protein SmpB [Chloroflexota bacterium]|nr:SsrA-binding protein SmpB [Chloroflexota bacterium]
MKATKTVALNRKARHDYHILDSVEAGIVLTGTEVKSIRAGRANIGDGYVRPEGGELWLLNTHIARFEGGNRYNHEPTRPRKLLLHRRQINDLSAKVMQRGYTIVPLKLYFKKGNAKVELGLARGKKLYDKRQSIAQRETERQMERALKLAKSYTR